MTSTLAETDSDLALEELARLLAESQRGEQNTRLTRLREELATAEGDMQYYAAELATAQKAVARETAVLRGLEATDYTAPDARSAAEELRLIRRLAGVKRVYADGNKRLIVEFRTRTLYEGWVYDMGDFAVILKRYPLQDNDTIHVRCTRTGVIENGCHLYFDADNGGELGWGFFCFGQRKGQIIELYESGRYREMLNLLISTMCGVNDEHWKILQNNYRRWRLSPKRREAWKLGRHPTKSNPYHPRRLS